MEQKRSTERLPIGPGHPLYPVLAAIALINLVFGRAEQEQAETEPEGRTHPYFPDHIWPYSVLAMVVLITLGLMALVGQSVLQLGAAADPRSPVVPHPDWYFLALFEFVKLGPALITSSLIPALLIVGLVFWPLIDEMAGPRLARRFGWRSWPVPRRNRATGGLWIVVFGLVTLLTLWGVLGPQLCVPWPLNGPVCGG